MKIPTHFRHTVDPQQKQYCFTVFAAHPLYKFDFKSHTPKNYFAQKVGAFHQRMSQPTHWCLRHV